MVTFPLEKFKCFYLGCYVAEANTGLTHSTRFLVDTGARMGFLSEVTLNKLGYKITDDLPIVKSVLATGIEILTPVITIPSVVILGREFSHAKFKTMKDSVGDPILGIDLLSSFKFTFDYKSAPSVFEIEKAEEASPANKPITVDHIYKVNVFS